MSNDDGVHAPGLEILEKAVSRVANVTVVAPMEEKSTTGHNLTLHKPLRMHAMKNGYFGVSGSPADCVYLGIREALKGRPPDLVISGINRGANLGQDVYYSGTVSAAREACMMGIPAFAVSLCIDFNHASDDSKMHYKTAAEALVKVIRTMNWRKMPKGTLVNLNVPDLPRSRLKGFRVATQGFRHYSGAILKRQDHRGRPYYWVGGKYEGFKAHKGSDCQAVDQGYATLTPLQLDCTDASYHERLTEYWPAASD
ncbi:MAG: 5'/3'-nucleotidase SurE [Bdellovibrionales bacterium]|nr:5'/3'-nucleotidase SurE [Bdellovibrionales bacterium]